MSMPDLLTQAVSRAEAIRVRNVINPLLWLSAIAFPLGLAGAWAFQNHPLFAAPILVTGLAPPLSTLAAYFYFMLRDPNRLHSEEFLIEQRRLMLERKGVAQAEDADQLPLTANPERQSLTSMRSPRPPSGGQIDG